MNVSTWTQSRKLSMPQLFSEWCPIQSKTILLMRAAMEGGRPNIRMFTTQDIIRARSSSAMLIRINSLIRLNSLETNIIYQFCSSISLYITKNAFHVEDPVQHITHTTTIFLHDAQWVQYFLVGGFNIAWKTIIILPQLEFIRCIQGGDLFFCYLWDFLINWDWFGYLCNTPINGD